MCEMLLLQIYVEGHCKKFSMLGKEILLKARKKRRRFEVAKVDSLARSIMEGA